MSEEISKKFEKCEENLEKIIKKEVPLRDPSIVIVKIPANHAEDIFKRHHLMLKKFQGKFKNWRPTELNMEKIFFDSLRAHEFIEGMQVARDCDRKEFANDVHNAILNDLIEQIQKEILALKEQYNASGKVPFLILINMHSTYPLIETGDIISRINNEKGVYIVILYIIRDKYTMEDSEPYKHGNYMVDSCSFI